MMYRTTIAVLLALGAVTTYAADEPLGRLFFTPEQRAALDAGRRIATTKKSPSAAKPAAPRGPREIELNGIVVRSDGSQTVWINNQAYQDRQPRGMRVEVRDPASAKIQVGRSGPKVDLQVGEAYQRSSRKGRERKPDVSAEQPGTTGGDSSRGSGSTKPAVENGDSAPAR
jgi:hypothetical protein